MLCEVGIFAKGPNTTIYMPPSCINANSGKERGVLLTCCMCPGTSRPGGGTNRSHSLPATSTVDVGGCSGRRGGRGKEGDTDTSSGVTPLSL